MFQLRAHQHEPFDALRRSLLAHRSALDASDTGIGKTYVASALAARLQRPALVVCPLSVRPIWNKVLTEAGANIYAIMHYEGLRRTKLRGSYAEHTRRGKGHHWNWNLPHNVLLIFDEVHRCKGQNSINSSMLIGARRQDIMTLMLSATAAENPLEMKALGFALHLFDMQNWWKWARSNGVCKDWMGHFMWPRGQHREGTKAAARVARADKKLRALHTQLFPEHGARVRKNDVPGFPEMQLTADAYDFSYDAAKWPEVKLQSDAFAQQVEEAVSDLELQTRQRQQAEVEKVPGLLSMTSDLIAEGNSVVLFVNYIATLELVTEYFRKQKTEIAMVRGGQDPAERQRLIDLYQGNILHFCACQIQAGGQSISLHDIHGARPRVALVCPTYSAVDLKQAPGRIHRDGALSKSICRLVYAAGTIEEEVCARVRKKLDNIDLINDGDLLGTGNNKEDAVSDRRVRKTRKAFVCHCGTHVSKGGEYYRYPDTKDGERFCKEQCMDTYIRSQNPASRTAVQAGINIATLLQTAWGSNPFVNEVKAVTIAPAHFMALAKHVNDEAKPEDVLAALELVYSADPFAEDADACTATLEQLEQVATALLPVSAPAEEPAVEPAVEPPADPSAEPAVEPAAAPSTPAAEQSGGTGYPFIAKPADQMLAVLYRHYIGAHLKVKIPQVVYDNWTLESGKAWNPELFEGAVKW